MKYLCVLACSTFLTQAAIAQSICRLPSPLNADTSQNFCTNPNFPIYGSGTTSGVITNPLPTIATATPGNNLTLQPGSTNAFSLIMGSSTANANLTTAQSIRDTFYFNYITGNLNNAVVAGDCSIDTGHQDCANVPFYAVARHYAIGDSHDLHLMVPTGVQLRAICSGPNAKNLNCTHGNIYGAMLRVPFEIRPGMTIKVRYHTAPGDHSWMPIWLYSGSEVSPGPETQANPYTYPYNYPIQLPQYGAEYEVDLNDNYSRFYNNPPVATGLQLDYGTPDIYGVPWTTPPHTTYMANTNGFTSYPNAGPPFVSLPTNWSMGGYHNLVLSWNAKSSLLYLFADGQLAFTSYLDYSFAPTYTDPADGVTKQQAMHLIIGNQAVPTFDPDNGPIMSQDSLTAGWTLTVQEISAWYGIVTAAAK